MNVDFVFNLRTNRENRLWEYTLTIYNMTFEDEVDFKVIAKSSVVEKSEIIKPKITGRNESTRDILSNLFFFFKVILWVNLHLFPIKFLIQFHGVMTNQKFILMVFIHVNDIVFFVMYVIVLRKNNH